VKVLYLSPYPPARDGIGSYTWTLANAVKDRGAEIAIVVPRAYSDSPPEVIGALTWAGHNYGDMRSVVAAWKPDIIHVQFAIAAFGGRTTALLRWLAVLQRDVGVPIVATLHEYSRESLLLPLLGRAIHRYVASRCDVIVVHTSSAVTGVISRCGLPATKVVLIPHPTAAPAPCTSSAELRARFELGDARVLLAFGFIHIDKGLDDLVRALSIVRQKSPGLLDNVRVVVAGAVRSRQGVFRVFEARDRFHLVRISSLVRRHGLQRSLVMTGYVPTGDVAGWFDLAAAAVLPYRRTEQSGVASLAQSFGIPVLASQVGGLAEQFKGTPWTFPPAAPMHLADTLIRFLTTPPSELTDTSSDPGRDNELASVVTRTLDLYQTASAKRRHGTLNAA
jgi:glycosyltransferase involved in cell wall biosynthesis